MQQGELPQILERLRKSPENSTAFDQSWTQGRSAFGGLSSAIALCGAARLLPSPQPARSVMVSFIGPIPAGEVTVVPDLQRQGRNVTQLSAKLMTAGELGLQIMAVFGDSRQGLDVRPDPGFRPEPRDPAWSIDNNPARPPFLRYFEGYWTGGGIPFSGKRDLRLGIWIRHRADMSAFPVEKLITLADIPPPVILSHYDQPVVRASSLTWSLEFVLEPETVDSDWFYLDFRVEHAANGYTLQSGKLFSEDGRLCALSRQCMVYFDQRVKTAD